MLIKVNDFVRKKSKEGEDLGNKYEERALIIGKKHKFEKKTAASGRVYGSLTIYEYNTYYHLAVFDQQLLELFDTQVDKNDVIVAVCNVQKRENPYKNNAVEDKYTMVECLAPKKMLLTPDMPIPEKHTHENNSKDDLDFDTKDDDNFDDFQDELPF